MPQTVSIGGSPSLAKNNPKPASSPSMEVSVEGIAHPARTENFEFGRERSDQPSPPRIISSNQAPSTFKQMTPLLLDLLPSTCK